LERVDGLIPSSITALSPRWTNKTGIADNGLMSSPALSPKFVESNVIRLAEANISEAEIEEWISNNPKVLGLGEVSVRRQRRQEAGGRLDMLLEDSDNDRRYELELMRGSLDPSHLVRSIEYWDVERRLYPAYEHCAVIVAEDIAARFLNVIQLFSGSVPIIAMQLTCIRIEGKLTLNLIRVLDSRRLRDDDHPTEAEAGAPVDMAYWERRVGHEILRIPNESIELINAVGKTPRSLRFNKGFIGLTENGQPNHFIVFSPKKAFVWIKADLESPKEWQEKLENAGLESKPRESRVKFKVTLAQYDENKDLIKGILQQSVKDEEA
jgi:hypothetical protein